MTLARPPHCLWHALRSPMQAPATPAREGTTAAPPPHHHHQQRTGEKERRKEGRKEGRKERKGEGEKGLASVQIPRIPDPKFTRNTNAHTHSRERREEERERERKRERERERKRERKRKREEQATHSEECCLECEGRLSLGNVGRKCSYLLHPQRQAFVYRHLG